MALEHNNNARNILISVENAGNPGKLIQAQERFKPLPLITYSSDQDFYDSPQVQTPPSTASQRETALNPRDTQINRFADINLTIREQDVIVLLGQGFNKDTIANQLGIKVKEVDLLIGGTTNKFGVKTGEEAVLASIKGGQVNITEFVNPKRKVDLTFLNDEQMQILGEITAVVSQEKEDELGVLEKRKEIAQIEKTLGVKRRVEAMIAYIAYQDTQAKTSSIVSPQEQKSEVYIAPAHQGENIRENIEEELESTRLSSYERYLVDVSNHPLLSPHETKALAMKRNAAMTEEERRETVNAIIEGNLRLVIRYVSKFRYEKISKLDLIAAGNLGLMRAAETFDPERGTEFSTHAVWKIRSAVDEFTRKVLRHHKVDSLDVQVHDDGVETMLDQLEDTRTNVEQSAIQASDFRVIFSQLDTRQQRILAMIHEGLTLSEIGKELGISGERVRVLKDIAFKKFRQAV